MLARPFFSVFVSETGQMRSLAPLHWSRSHLHILTRHTNFRSLRLWHISAGLKFLSKGGEGAKRMIVTEIVQIELLDKNIGQKEPNRALVQRSQVPSGEIAWLPPRSRKG